MGQLIRQIKKKNGLIRRFAEEEDAVGVVEIILILVVLIGLVIIFKEQLTELVRKGKRKHYIISCINTQSAFVSCMYKYRICTYGIGQNPNTQQYGYRTLFCIWTV